jgi:hypothetical protein
MSVAPLTATDRTCPKCGARLSVYAPVERLRCLPCDSAGDALSRRELAEARGLSQLELPPSEARPDPERFCPNRHERELHERRTATDGRRYCAECRRERDRRRNRRGRDRSGERKQAAPA